MSLRARSSIRLMSIALLVLAASALSGKVVVAQDAVSQTADGWQSPTAAPGGPFVTSTGQSIVFDGGSSWSFDGPIIYYYWDFGDGTSATGPNPSHQYSAEGVYTVTLTVCDDLWNCASSESFATAGSVNVPARINFDGLPNNLVVADQFLSEYGVRFYSGNSFYPTHTAQNCGPCSTTSPPNFISTKPDDAGIVNVEFTQPVNNLTFYMIGVDVFFSQFAWIDVYRNGSFYGSYPVYGNGTRTVGYTFGSMDNISKVVIRNITDVLGIGFDDFTFNVPSDIKIASGRVSGYLNGTTQNALLGADIALNATAIPSGFSGGTYSWSFAGPYQVVTGTTSSSVIIRSTEIGAITATVTYSKNGLTATGSLTINPVLPTVTSFTGQQTNDRINSPGQCNQHLVTSFWWYEVGCPDAEPGITFLADVRAPTSFISDPSQSAVKFVQAISIFQKKMQRGLRCNTRRSSEGNIDSGWQLDGDPLSREIGSTMHFSVLGSPLFPGNSLSIGAHDSPGDALTGFVDADFVDAVYDDDRFETYVVYFADHNGPQPFLQRPIGRLRWNWGGFVVFDEITLGTYRHRLRFTNAPPRTVTGEGTTAPMVSMQGNWSDNQPVPCAGGPPVSLNPVDSSRHLVKEYYQRILGRAPDEPWWGGWTSKIAICEFDLNCNVNKRTNVALGFFWSPEFIQQMNAIDPQTGLPVDCIMANPPGSQNFDAGQYNPRFVHWCYQKFLNRDEDPGGLAWYSSYLSSTGDYAGVVYAFIYSNEFRNQMPRIP